MSTMKNTQSLEVELCELKKEYRILVGAYEQQKSQLHLVIDFAEKLEARLCALEKPFDMAFCSEVNHVAQ